MWAKPVWRVGFWVGIILTAAAPSFGASPEQILGAMKSAATYYHDKVARHGGYVYYYSLDLSQRWGEGKADAETIFVQPPGTPTVGMAYLRAYSATKDAFYLDAARDAAEALVYGQLQSGGWTQTIHFGAAKRLGKYRGGGGGSWNASSLDDNQTQAALLMLIRADEALGFKHAKVHEAATYGLNALLAAQFPVGAFPQVWTGPVKAHPAAKTKYPEYDWRTEGKVKDYWDCYTLNDNVCGNVAAVLLEAHRVYKDERYTAALKRLGEFLIAAQMPDPQPGWAQQYNYEMVPIWARKFEPPAITAWEAQDVMRTLIAISRHAKDDKYLAPIPRALAYYKKCVMPDGRVARYYELRTNKPLYMDDAYRLTYDESVAPAHYGWKQPARFEEIERALQLAKSGQPEPAPSAVSAEAVGKIIGSLEQGRWVSTYGDERLVGQPKFPAGFKYLSSGVFSQNLETLSDYLVQAK